MFRPVKFFEKSKSFLELVVLAMNIKDFNNWKGHIESKFRKFIKIIVRIIHHTLNIYQDKLTLPMYALPV